MDCKSKAVRDFIKLNTLRNVRFLKNFSLGRRSEYDGSAVSQIGKGMTYDPAEMLPEILLGVRKPSRELQNSRFTR